jgi:hypothetical protein
MAILVAYKKNITTEATAKLIFERVWVHFEIPQTIISNCDSRHNPFQVGLGFQPLGPMDVALPLATTST